MSEHEDIGWRSYIPGLALIMSIVGALLAAGSLIQKVNYLETRASLHERDLQSLSDTVSKMNETLVRIDERTGRLAADPKEKP